MLNVIIRSPLLGRNKSNNNNNVTDIGMYKAYIYIYHAYIYNSCTYICKGSISVVRALCKLSQLMSTPMLIGRYYYPHFPGTQNYCFSGLMSCNWY